MAFDISKYVTIIQDIEAVLNVLLGLQGRALDQTGGSAGRFGAVSPDDAASKISAIRAAVEQHAG